jgi:Raf kinase inhibitor-like YbhB/YbcL family protein
LLKSCWQASGDWHGVRIVGTLIAVGALLFVGTGTAMALTLTSSAFPPGGKIPSKYTCEGKDVSPPLSFAGAPNGTKSLALVIDDPDAPDPKAPRLVWVHWVVFNLPADSKGLSESPSGRDLPNGAVTGLNDWKKTSYGGPCPPVGRHRYFHKLYALDVALPAKPLTKSDLEAAMKGHILAQAELIGTYQKGDP